MLGLATLSKPGAREQNKERTRESLECAARAVFVRDGVPDAKVSDIVAAAGVAHGTFYVHFKNKAEVADRLIVAFNREHGRRLVAAAIRHLSQGARAVIRAQAREHIAYWREQADFFPVVVDHVARHTATEPLLLRNVSDDIASFADEVLASCNLTARVPTRELARIIVNLWRQAGLHVATDTEVGVEQSALALELSTIAIYDALAPGLTDISKRALAGAYRRMTERAEARRRSTEK